MSLSKSEIQDVLSERLVWIATTKPNGRPHVVPIWFVQHQADIWFETDITTQKFKNIQKSNRVMMSFGVADTYVIEGYVEWFKEDELDFPIRKIFHQKYKRLMLDRYITKHTRLFKVTIDREISWHNPSPKD